MDIILGLIIACFATNILGGCLIMLERYLHWRRMVQTTDGEENIVYVEIPTNKNDVVYTSPKSRKEFLNKTLIEATSCNCPILCELLIERGASNVEQALDIAIANGHMAVCKVLIEKGQCDLDLAMTRAKVLRKKNIEEYITDYCQQSRKELNLVAVKPKEQ